MNQLQLRLVLLTLIFIQLESYGQSCDCNEYIYLNEPTSASIHKYLVNTDGSLTEIGAPWFDNPTGEVNSPHGITMDQNGNIYVGEHVISSDIRKISCDGELLPESEFAIATGGQFNIGSLDNYLYYNERSSDIVEYDLCSGEKQYAEFCENTISSRDWGFYADPRTGIMYATYNLAGNTDQNYLWVMTQADFDNDPTTCVTAIPMDPEFPATNAEIRGVTTDMAGNIYVVVQDDTNQSPPDCYILKFDANGNHLATSPSDNADDGTGFNKLIGVVYSYTADLIFASTEASFDDCIAVFDTDLNYVGTGVPSPGGGDRGKGIAIIKECCPTSTPVVIDTILCATGGEQISLQSLINCEGAICEGDWTPDAGNSGITLRGCDETVSFTTDDACGTFILASDGNGTHSQCGPFNITVNVAAVSSTAATISSDATICTGESFMLTGTLSGNGSPTYQWQSSTTSCTEGFSDISGANSSDLTVNPTMSTFYRLVTSTTSGCSSLECMTISNCMQLTIDPDCSSNPCDSPSCDPVPMETLCADGSESLTLACQTSTTDVSWYDSNGNAVGSGCNLVITPSMVGDGTSGETMCFYYEANDMSACSGETCCPIIIELIDCCPTENCLGISITRN